MMSYTIIYSWIKAVTGFDDQHIIRANQTGKRPKDDFITYFLIGGHENDYSHMKKVDEIDSIPIPDDNVEVTYTTPETLIYDIQAYSINGKEILKDLLRSKYLFSARNILKIGNLVIANRSEIRNLTLFSDTVFRPRYQADFTFRTMDEMKETNQKILEFELHGKFDNMDVIIDI